MYKHDNNSKLNRNSTQVLYRSSKFYKNNENNINLITKYKVDDR